MSRSVVPPRTLFYCDGHPFRARLGLEPKADLLDPTPRVRLSRCPRPLFAGEYAYAVDAQGLELSPDPVSDQWVAAQPIEPQRISLLWARLID